MPTTTVKSIGTSSRDYSTLQAWEDACPSNLVTNDEIWKGECYNDSEFSRGCTFGGVTTDSTRYLELTTASGQSFVDHSGVRTNALTYDQTKGVGVSETNAHGSSTWSIGTNHTRISKLQVKIRTQYGSSFAIGGSSVRVTDCIIDGNFPTPITGSGSYAANCLLRRFNSGSVIQRGTWYACTIIASGGAAIFSEYNTSVLKNCAVFGGGTLRNGSLAAGSDYNATDLADSWGTGSNNLNSLTYADQFENSASDWRAKSSGSLDGAGVTDATYYPNDISGTARANPPTIGAWEVTGGGGGGTVVSSAYRLMLMGVQ